MYINIHSHHPQQPGEWAIRSLYRDFEESAAPGNYSIGLHPWYIHNENWKRDFELLKRFSENTNVLAIGECGLDKACSTAYHLQEAVFIAQLLWANENGKPLIIHCVRAYEEILNLLKKHKNRVPVLFHGFNKNSTLAGRIISEGHWLSFGKALFSPDMRNVFSNVPSEKIFLESDDATISIKSLYEQAAEIKKISLDKLSLQLEKNVQTVFNRLAVN